MAACLFDPKTIMGEKTMFDLNEQITKWRSNLTQTQILDNSDIDELEGHLREEIQHLISLKLSEQESFCVARHRLGDTNSLAEEFSKINVSVLWRKRLFWALAGLLGYIVTTYIAKSASAGFVVLAWFAGVKGYSLGILDIVSQVLFFLTAILLLYKIGTKAGCQGELFHAAAEKPLGKFGLFAGVLLITALLLACRFLVPVTVARLSIEQWGQMAMFRAYSELVWTIAVPLILLAALIYLRPSRLRQAGT